MATIFTVFHKNKKTGYIVGGKPLYRGADQAEAARTAREKYVNPVKVQLDPKQTAGGFEEDPSDGTYTVIDVSPTRQAAPELP